MESLQLITDVDKVKSTIKILEDKSGKALAALSSITDITTPEQDSAANRILQKVRATYNTVSALRKEITDPMDNFKAEIMEFEKKIDTKKSSSSEYYRVKLLRDKFATKIAEEARKKQQEIENEKRIKQEIARIKSEMVISVESSIINMIKSGEIALSKMLSAVTLETYDETINKLNYKPLLKQETFERFLMVNYDKSLINEDEFEEIKSNAIKHFDYDKVAKTYVDQSLEVLNKYRSELFPEKRITLESLAKMDEQKRVRAAEIAKEAEDRMINERKRELEDSQHEKIESARDSANEEFLSNEFDAQIQNQSIEQQTGVRKKVSYRFSPEAEKRPALAIEAMTKIMTQVLSNPNNKGLFKRDSGGFIKMDDKGQPEYVDGISYWFKECSRLHIDEESKILNLVQTIDVTSIAK